MAYGRRPDLFEQFITWLFARGGAWSVKGLDWASSKVHPPRNRAYDAIENRRLAKTEFGELNDLYAELSRYSDTAEQLCSELITKAVRVTLNPPADKPPSPIVKSATCLCWNILHYEKYYPPLMIDLQKRLALEEIWEYKKIIRNQLALYTDRAWQQAVARDFKNILAVCLKDGNRVLVNLSINEDDDVLTFIPLISLNPHPALTVDKIFPAVISAPEEENTPFRKLATTLMENSDLASGANPNSKNYEQQLKKPSQIKVNSIFELIELCLGRTPFLEFLRQTVPYTIPYESRFSHMHVVGGSGHGKTQLLQRLILSDLELVKAGKASLIVIDSQGDMIGKIQRLKILAEMPERVVIIDPNDIEHPPALNLFDFGLSRITRYDQRNQRALLYGAIDLYAYIFGALLRAEMTQRQDTVFKFLAQLMMKVPGAKLSTLLNFVQHPETARPYIEKLDDTPRLFFETEFFSNNFAATRRQLASRIWGILGSSHLASMFDSDRNKVDLFDAMNRGSLILINTAKELLKQDACEIFGRFFIALISQATQERAALDEKDRMATFVYLDEAQDYFDKSDTSFVNLLTQARKYRVGLILAHQFLGQFDSRLYDAVMANTVIKVAGGLSDNDARRLSGEMRCSPEYLLSMKKYQEERRTEFACFVKEQQSHPIKFTVQFGTMEARPQLNQSEEEELLYQNRMRYCQIDKTLEKGKPPGEIWPDEDNKDKPDQLTDLDEPELL